ncbi:uncharacterized protein K452DRAFT_52651 [Aplosporella prunicola CBS 121167]|uniref:Uncharacterized protein n=1 Tax=Aplosporella prunicola CBS 121167 TaxID=1176127 RepID=A0A6A6B7N4_9PEZI|nr:uncharacterized protein K452DRAFT_52651 [Aplosporella prunicola CBS 121167]KAF2140202.1 hypothetical protein K452DRAFT_52651 [Aplosporella prunicola CBS 121167]
MHTRSTTTNAPQAISSGRAHLEAAGSTSTGRPAPRPLNTQSRHRRARPGPRRGIPGARSSESQPRRTAWQGRAKATNSCAQSAAASRLASRAPGAPELPS